MRWFRRNRKKSELQVLREASIAIFTRDAWFRCFAGTTETAWQEEGHEDDVHMAIVDNLKRFMDKKICDIKSLKDIRMVAIDEEYFQWLEKEGKEDGEESRDGYIRSVSDEKAEHLWKKNHMGMIYTCCSLVCTLLGVDLDRSATTRFLLTKEQQACIREQLEKIFGEGTVWASRQFVVPEDFVRDEDAFREEGRSWLKEGNSFSRRCYDEQHFYDSRINVLNLCIPVVVSCHYDYRISLEKLFADFANIRAFPDQFNMMDRPEFESINDILVDVAKQPVSFVNPLLIRPRAMEDFLVRQAEMIRKSIRKMQKEMS